MVATVWQAASTHLNVTYLFCFQGTGFLHTDIIIIECYVAGLSFSEPHLGGIRMYRPKLRTQPCAAAYD